MRAGLFTLTPRLYRHALVLRVIMTSGGGTPSLMRDEGFFTHSLTHSRAVCTSTR